MPVFNYKCLNPDCEIEFEDIIVRSTDVAQCPKCEGKEVKKLVSAPNRMKGSEPYYRKYGRRK